MEIYKSNEKHRTKHQEPNCKERESDSLDGKSKDDCEKAIAFLYNHLFVVAVRPHVHSRDAGQGAFLP